MIMTRSMAFETL